MDTFTESLSRTYTVADVGKVLDCFAADLDGVGQSTGLRSRDNTRAVAADVKSMAEAGYLSEVNLYLKNVGGVIIRAAKYEIITDAGHLSTSRPGNYLWPRTPGGQLCVHVTYNQTWWRLSDAQRSSFKQQLNVNWGTLDLDTSFPTLLRQHDRNYVSNGFGLQKTMFA